jgi:hypothetical protein
MFVEKQRNIGREDAEMEKGREDNDFALPLTFCLLILRQEVLDLKAKERLPYWRT